MIGVGFALDAEGQVMTPLTAPRGAHYTCLECAAPVGVRRGPERRWHFYHLPGFERDCAGESLTHKAAKRLLAQSLRRELEAGGEVTWQQRCVGVGGPCPTQALLPRTFFADGWTDVVEEVGHGAFRFDVAVVADHRVLFGLEVFFRHAVPEPKAEALDVLWLELLAEDILAHRPRVPTQGGDGTERCVTCEERARLVQERGRDDAARDVVTSAFDQEVQRVTGTWAAVLSEARALSPARPQGRRGQQDTAAPALVRGPAPKLQSSPEWADFNAWVGRQVAVTHTDSD